MEWNQTTPSWKPLSKQGSVVKYQDSQKCPEGSGQPNFFEDVSANWTSSWLSGSSWSNKLFFLFLTSKNRKDLNSPSSILPCSLNPNWGQNARNHLIYCSSQESTIFYFSFFLSQIAPSSTNQIMPPSIFFNNTKRMWHGISASLHIIASPST